MNPTSDAGREALANIEEMAFRAMLANTADMVFIKDLDLKYVSVSQTFVEMVGKKTADEIINRTDYDIFDDENLAMRYVTDDRALLRDGKNQLEFLEPITSVNGQARYGSTSKYILRDADGNPAGILGITRDVTKEYYIRRHYQTELKYLFELPEDMYLVTYIDVDDWRIISQRRQNVQKGAFQTFDSIKSLIKQTCRSIVDKHCDAAIFYHNFDTDTLKQHYTEGRSTFSFEYQRLLANQSTRWVHNEVKFLINVDNGHLCVMLSARDIEEKQQAEQRLFEDAKMDKMTHLLNRETTMENIRKILDEEEASQHALFIIDIDNFKSLNDTLGHKRGDEFLVELASVLKKSFRATDVVGRIGGDEFFALMRNISGNTAPTRKAKELLSEINSICKNYERITLSASIGVGVYPRNGILLDELYTKADEALYQAKRQGKNQYVFASA